MRLFSFLAIALLAPSAFGQPKPSPTPGDKMFDAYLAAETDKLSKKFLDGAKTLDEWNAKRPRLHREYLEMLGLWPLPDKSPLNATVTKTFESQGVFIDNLHFQSRPGLYVTANLYRPKNNEKKLPTILYVCGHSNRGRDGNKSAFQDHGLWFASNGYNCLILDTLQLGEIPGIHHGTYREGRWWWHSAGYTPAGVECWNGIRAIDYLLTRSDVDADKIGVTGISGGGAATIWIAAADDRVKVAVPVSGMADLECYVKDKIVNGHCDCMFLYNTYQWEWTTILALIAPRPLLFANSDNDPIFPMNANRRIAERMRTLYGYFGKPKNFDDYVSSGGHAYRPDLRVAIFRFLNEHLKSDKATPVEDSAKFAAIPGKDLRVFPADDDLPKDRINGKIDETFVPRGKLELPTKEGFADWRDKTIRELKDRCFRPLGEFGDEVPNSEGLTRKSPPNTVERSLVLLGQTEDFVKFAKIEAALRSAKRSDLVSKGRGADGILGAYAALFSPKVAEVVLEDPPTTHRDGPHLLGVLRMLDIPEALGLLAPRPLTIIGDAPAFDRTEEIYRLAGAADKLKRVKK